MAIKFEKVQPGMVLWDVHSERMGNTTMRELGAWEVLVESVDADKRTAVVRWNYNRPETWRERELVRLYAKLPPRYLAQEERQRARGW